MPHFLANTLLNSEIYERQILSLHDKYRVGGKDILVETGGVEFSVIANEARSFAKAMAMDIRSGSYQIQPALLRTIVVKGKERVIYKFGLSDLILHGAVSATLHDHCKDYYSENLHSYIKGKNYWEALKSFSKYTKKHFSQKIDTKDKGFYVLRRDIASYTDTIPVGDKSPLWGLLRRELKFPERPSREENLAWKYMQGVIRAEVIAAEGAPPSTKETGVPTGSPISTTLFNLYMVDLDRSLDALKPGFYARYGDDLIFADTELKKVKVADLIFKEILKDYELRSKAEKEDSLFFNIAGRKPEDPEAIASGFKGADRIIFLGCDIMAKGSISVSRKLEKDIIEDIRLRLSHGSRHAIGENQSRQTRLKNAINIVNKALDPENRLSHKASGVLRYGITDRSCLKRLDYQICRLILKEVIGYSSVKGFRKLSIREMRKNGLVSLVAKRNRVGRPLWRSHN